MSKHAWDQNDTTGYFLSEDSQARLRKLREHMVFLSQLAQPRSADEEQRGSGPQIVGSELEICMELLAEQVEWVLDAVTWPAERKIRKAPGEVAAEQETDGAQEDFAFGITLEQMSALDALVDRLSAHGDDGEGGNDEVGTSPVEHAIGEGLDALREIFAEVRTQELGSRVGETRAVYGCVPMLPPPLGVSEGRAAYLSGALRH